LTVRQDNAIRRLAPIALALGLYDSAEQAIVARRLAAEDEARSLADKTSIQPDEAAPILTAASSAALPHPVRLSELARRQHISLQDLFRAKGVGSDLPADAIISAELELKYSGYFERERSQADKLRRMGEFTLDPSLPYDQMRSLSLEARQKLARRQPCTLAQAAGTPGVSPSDLQNLVIEIEKRRRAGAPTRARSKRQSS
jgi:tRNA uridine 5-carboxymethylaminomethyl modification enzyme